MPDKTLTVILAGGQGTRLAPLTQERSKPAIPFGGKYRLIDFTLTNCLHSGLRRILVLTQYKSHSLQKHLRDGWSLFNPELSEYITTVPPQMRTGDGWYGGTANAVYQNLYMLKRSGAELVLVLSGDHIYRMDYAAMIHAHRGSGAGVTIACAESPAFRQTGGFRVTLDEQAVVTGYQQCPADIEAGENGQSLLAMGVYLFNLDLLIEALEADHASADSVHDLAESVLPALVERHCVQGYRFGGAAGRVSRDRYWQDVATLDAYYEANMELLRPLPSLNLYQPEWPIRTYEPQYPPARTVPGLSGDEGLFLNSIVAGGVVISGGSVQHSILFPGVRVGEEAVIHDAILFDNVQVGDGAQLEHCIIDKDVEIPPGTRIGLDKEQDRQRFTLSEGGVVVVPKGYRFQ